MAEKKKKILVVEDVPEVQQMLELVLTSEGYDVEIAGNGIKLVKKIREYMPDLITMDIMLPWINGFDLCDTIRDIEGLKDIPIVVISAKTAPEDIQRAYDVGAVDFLEKPVVIDELLATIRTHLNGETDNPEN